MKRNNSDDLKHTSSSAAKKTKSAVKTKQKSAAETPKKPKRRTPLILRFLRSVGTVILSTFLSFLLIFCVTGFICAIAATAYVTNFMDETKTITIQELTTSFNTNVYATNSAGETVQLYEVKNEVLRIPVEIDQIPQHVRNAFVCAEDERFYSHEGVDYKRTAASFANMILHFWSTDQGGSTITQQLIKNLTGDTEISAQRKIREIFRAMQLEKSYSKDEILCTYINYVGFGGSANGVEKAADKYFGKHVWELSIAEAACLAAIPQNPEKINPFAGYYQEDTNPVTHQKYYTDEFVNTGMELNRNRMEYILGQMYKNGCITFDEYQKALAEKLIFTNSEEYKALHPELFDENGVLLSEKEEHTTNTSWVIDKALYEFRDYLMEEKGYSQQRAMNIINKGGYQIYTTVDLDMQAYVEDKFSDLNNLLRGLINAGRTNIQLDRDKDGVPETISLQCGFTAIDYQGNILCTVGGIGGHPAPLCTSYACTEPQQPGSAIKPVTSYGYALEHDYISYATHVLDYPPLTNPDTGKPWPTNYSNDSDKVVYTNAPITIQYALEVSKNTIPALLCKTYGVGNVYDFATETLGLSLNYEKDRDYAPLAVGALSYGVTVEDLVNAYMVYGNGGYFSDAHIISRVETADGGIVYAGGEDYSQVISEETSYVMNKLLRQVVDGEQGTAKKARIYSHGMQVPICGKTGTSSDWFDKLFVGLNPDFVSGIWIGYPINHKILNYGSIDTGAIWKNIIGDWISNHYSGNNFPECKSVVTGHYCATTGKIAGANCAKGGIGYWKSTYLPYCDGGYNALGLVKP